MVSLLPSATEILAAVGGASLLVGRSHECDFPPGVGSLPVLTRARTGGGSPVSIDASVREAIGKGESLYEVDESLLRRLAPDVILTQDLCEVCSVHLRTVERLAAGLTPKPRVVSLNPRSFEGVLDDVLTVGEAVGLAADARRTVVMLRERFHAARDHVNPYADGPVVEVLEWTDPPFTAGHWTAQLIEQAGGRHPLNAVARGGGAGKSRRVGVDELVASVPEFLVIAPCGFTLEKTREAAASIAREPWFRQLPAVRYGRVALVDGNQMFNRPGPRLIDAFEWLVGWIHDRAELIPPGFPWERLDAG